MSAPMLVAGALVVAALPLVYHPPVDAPVADRFRPPVVAYGPGNRGLEYATRPGAPVRAAASGTVAFAGAVGRSLHVSIVHGDGVRTTYSFLARIDVRRGAQVEAGDVLGRAGERFHLGALVGDVYVDPAVLLATPKGRARLVADDP